MSWHLPFLRVLVSFVYRIFSWGKLITFYISEWNTLYVSSVFSLSHSTSQISFTFSLKLSNKRTSLKSAWMNKRTPDPLFKWEQRNYSRNIKIVSFIKKSPIFRYLVSCLQKIALYSMKKNERSFSFFLHNSTLPLSHSPHFFL